MTTVAKSAGTSEAVELDVTMTGRNGRVLVEVTPDRPASVTVNTADDRTTPSHVAVADAGLAWEEARPESADKRGRLVAQITSDVDPREGSKVEVLANVPPGSSVSIVTDGDGVVDIGAGDLKGVHVESRGEVRVSAESADVFVHTGGPVLVKDAKVVDIRSTGEQGPGRDQVVIGRGGAIDVATTSGNIRIREANGSVEAHSKTGSITIEALGPQTDPPTDRTVRAGSPGGPVIVPEAVPAGVRLQTSGTNGNRSVGGASGSQPGAEAERSNDFPIRKRDAQRMTAPKRLGI